MVPETGARGADTPERSTPGDPGPGPQPEPDTAYPAHWEADVVLRDGATAHLRPVTPEDQQLLLEMFHGQSETTIYLRFFSHKTTLTRRELARYTTVDHRDRVCFVILLGAALIGVGRYDRVGSGAEAEVAFMIADAHQGRGIGSILLEHLAAAARENGIDRFTAEVLPENRSMLHVFVEAGYDVARRFDDGVVALDFPIDPTERSVSVMASREHRAEARSTARILTPRTIAVVGASADPTNGGHTVVSHLLDGGFAGSLYGVNPTPFQRDGLRFAARVGEIEEQIDLAVVTVPMDAVLEVVADCGRAGAHAVVVMTGGWAEAGPEGAARQQELVRTARIHGMRVVGPASLGILNNSPEHRVDATVLPGTPQPGTLGLFSQSGALGILQCSAAIRHRVGVSTFVSAGNRADVSGNDVMQYWEDDAQTSMCGLALQSFGNPRKFSRIARRLAMTKPVVVAKSEVTGLRLPPGHTGRTTEAPVGTLDAMLRQAGVIRVATAELLMDVAAVGTGQPLPAGEHTALVANAMALARLMEDTAARLDMPVALNLDRIDTGAGGREGLERLLQGLREALADPRSSAVVLATIPIPGCTTEQLADAVCASVEEHRQARRCDDGQRPEGEAPPEKTVVLAATGDIGDAAVSRVHRDGQGRTLPVFQAPSAAVTALRELQRWARWRAEEDDLASVPEDIDDDAAEALLEQWAREVRGEMLLRLDRERVARLLGTYGIAVLASERFQDVEDGLAAAARLGYPVALKSTDAHLRRRLDLGGVRLGIETPEQFRDAVASMRRGIGRRAEHLDVQSMAPTGQAVVLRATEDPLIGPVISFGMAGDAVTMLADLAHRVPPLTDRDVQRLVREPMASRKLFGHEGQPPVAVTALEDLVRRVALLKDRHPQIGRLELNPVLLSPERLTVLEAEVRLGNAQDRTDSARRAMRR